MKSADDFLAEGAAESILGAFVERDEEDVAVAGEGEVLKGGESRLRHGAIIDIVADLIKPQVIILFQNVLY